MKPILIWIGLLTGVAFAQTPRYIVTDLGTLGGKSSVAFGISPAGAVAGGANAPGERQHVFTWSAGHITDLGTLGGLNANAAGPNGAGDLGGLSDTATTDPLGENFCGFGTGQTCQGFLYRNGKFTPLPTLGGNNGQAVNINNRSQVIGFAEKGTRDANCVAPQVLDFEAVIWSPNGDIQELHPLPGDTVSLAIGINDKGQAVGSSGTCANVTTAGLVGGPHAVIWNNGVPTDLGSLGGKLVNTAASINNLGEVIGGSNLPGDTALHGFLWTKDQGMQDLGTLSGDLISIPTYINNSGQIVGASCDATGNCRAFLFQRTNATGAAPNTCVATKGTLIDMNTLIPADSPLALGFAFALNDAGEIAGQAFVKATGELHAFLAVPAPPTRASAQPKGATVTTKSIVLDGTKSTSGDGKPLLYSWTVAQGSPSVAILQGNTATPTVQFGSTRGSYTFVLTVMDSSGVSATDSTTMNYQGN